MPVFFRVFIIAALFIEYHSYSSSVNCLGNDTITPLHCFGCHISSNLTRFARVVTAIIKLALLEL